MLKRVRRVLRDVGSNTSGNAALLAAIGMPVLIGSAGLAVDFSQWYTWKRELQLATDQAAVAAAWARTDTLTQSLYQVRGTQDYNANLALTKNFASAPTFALADYSNGTANSVVVTATATKLLPFSSIITGRAVTVFALSQASFAQGQAYASCLTALQKTGTGFAIGGNATVDAKCGLAALSCDPDALTIDGSATVTTNSIAVCGTADVPASLDSVTSENVSGLSDPFASLTPPTNSQTGVSQCAGKGSNKACVYSAGTYSGGITVNSTSTFSPGVYVIDGGTLDLTANYTVTGTGVMFVLKNGATLKLGGSGNGNTLNLSGILASTLTASPYNYSQTDANALEGMLIFEDRNNNPSTNHIINGNSDTTVTNSSGGIKGTIYLPSGTAQINGTANIYSKCLQIAANKITVLGNATLNTQCGLDDTSSVGNSAASVRLVA